ncbi:cytochrome P450 [Mycolicibacterium phlei]|nr:cytochrome P450 [Mycolicibacterium phlei]
MTQAASVPCAESATTYVSPPGLRVARMLSRLPRLGDTVGLMLDPTFYLFEKYLRHGPVFTVKTPYQTYTVLAGADAATFMSSKEGRECLTVGSSWRFVEEQFGGRDSLVAVDGPQHKQWRTLLQRGYSREAIAGRYAEAVDVIDDAVDKHWKPGQSVPVLPAMQKLSIAQVGTFVGGVRPTDNDIEDIALVTRDILKIAPVQHIPKFMLRLPRYVNARSRMVSVAQSAIALARRTQAGEGPSRSALLDDILESCANDPEATNQRNMLFHSVLPYFAGVETTSATATYALYLILKHPTVLARIQHEVDAMFAAGDITHDGLFHATPVLHGAVMEAMRLHPIASFIIRVAAQDFEFHGHRIRRGEGVFVGTTVPHFLSEFYPDPMRFDVDRYGDSVGPNRTPGAYSPFGRGPHMCVGKGLAESLMQLMLARIIHRRTLEPSSPSYRLSNRISSSSPSPKFAVRVVSSR